MPALGADLARNVADSVGAVGLDEEATAELGLHLELHLRGVIVLALKLARRACRQKLCCRDIRDAIECLGPTGASGSSEHHQAPSALRLVQHCIAEVAQTRTNGGNSMHRIAHLGAPRYIGSPPRDMHLRVEWLAVNGAVVASFNGSTNVDRMQSEQPLLGGCSQWLCPTSKPSGPLLTLTDEHLALLHRITRVLDGGDDMSRWYAPTIAMCRHEVCRPLLPFLAQFLVHKVPACISDASPAELCMLLRALGVVALAPQATERYLHQCLPAAMLLCLSPDMGVGYRERAKPGEISGYCGTRRHAAALVAEIVSRSCRTLPEVYAEVQRVFHEALVRSPPLAVVGGSILGLTALGCRSLAEVFIPAMLGGSFAEHFVKLLAAGLEHMRRDVLASNQSGSLGGTNNEARIKRARFAMPAQWLSEGRSVMDARADAFDAFFSAVATVVAGVVHSPTAAVPAPIQQAALVCEGGCHAFGAEPTPHITALLHPCFEDTLNEDDDVNGELVAPEQQNADGGTVSHKCPSNLSSRDANAFQDLMRRLNPPRHRTETALQHPAHEFCHLQVML